MTRLLLPCLLALASAGCTDGGGTAPFEPPATVLLVEPAQFLGSVPCLDAPGAMRRYVATLFDVTSPPGRRLDVSAVTLPSSAPAPCHLGVRFSIVTPGHRYTAEIDAYDRDDVAPFAPGGRIMEDADGNVVLPRWTTSCAGGSSPAETFFADGGIVYGEADGSAAPPDGGEPDLSIAVLALEQTTVPMRACLPLQDRNGETGATGLIVDLSTALLNTECGDGAGQVRTFTATIRETGETRSSRCDAPIEFTGLADGEEYGFDVVAEGIEPSDAGAASGAPDAAPEGGSASDGATATTARYATFCYGVATGGIVRRAACDPVHPIP